MAGRAIHTTANANIILQLYGASRCIRTTLALYSLRFGS